MINAERVLLLISSTLFLSYLTVSILGLIQGIPGKQVANSQFFFIEGASSLVLTQFVAKYDPSGAYLATRSCSQSSSSP